MGLAPRRLPGVWQTGVGLRWGTHWAGLVVVAFAIFGFVQGSLAALVAGVIVMDLAVQSSQVSNQARVYALDPAARSRLNTVFMTTMFCGGAVGSGLRGLAFQHMARTGTCLFGGSAALLGLLLSLSSLSNQPKT